MPVHGVRVAGVAGVLEARRQPHEFRAPLIEPLGETAVAVCLAEFSGDPIPYFFVGFAMAITVAEVVAERLVIGRGHVRRDVSP